MLSIAYGVLHHQWKPKIDGRVYPHTGEAARHHTDDREVCSVELDLLAQDGSGAAETPLPEAVADDGDRMPVEGTVILGGKQPAKFGIDS